MVLPRLFQPKDPRLFQITFLGSLLFVGFFFLHFTIRPEQILLNFASCLLTQLLFMRFLKIPQVGYKSALITALGFSILGRADNLWAQPLAAAIGVGAKFLARGKAKHIFNPGNLALITVILLPGGWASPGQWGNTWVIAAWFVLMGFWLVQRVKVMMVSWTFLGFYLGLLLTRVLWLGQRPEVFLHQMESGGLIMFTFFMISDPMTSPSHWKGRVLHAALVASIAFIWQFHFFWFNGLYWGLWISSLFVPLWDVIWPAEKPIWVKESPRLTVVGPEEKRAASLVHSFPAAG